MIKDKQSFLNRLHVILDILVLLVVYWGTYLVKIVWIDQTHTLGTFQLYIQYQIIVVLLFLLLYYAFQLYTPKRTLDRLLELTHIIQANALGILILTLILYLRREENISRWFLFYLAIVNSVALCIERNSIRYMLRFIRKKGLNLRHVLVVGYSKAAQAYIDRVQANSHWGYQIHGILDDKRAEGHVYGNTHVIGSIDRLEEILGQNELDEVIIALSLSEYDKLASVVNMCEKSGVHTKFVPDYQNIIPTRPYTEDLLGLPVVNIRRVPLTNWGNAFVKRMMDVFGSLAAIVIFSPVMLVTVIAIKLTSKGPIIFRQERVGLHNRPFYMYKFRSMIVQTEESEQDKWTTKGDVRVTRVGSFIRKTSIDELPQLFNVLKGDMSLVGPRPERPFFVEKFKEEIPRYMVKHQVRPGMTGWAQVNGWRGDTSIPERIACDLYYIENWTLLLDVKIMFMTVFKGFVNKNAY